MFQNHFLASENGVHQIKVHQESVKIDNAKKEFQCLTTKIKDVEHDIKKAEHNIKERENELDTQEKLMSVERHQKDMLEEQKRSLSKEKEQIHFLQNAK